MLSRRSFHNLKMRAWHRAAMQTASSTRVQTSHIRNSSVGYLPFGRTSHQIFEESGIDFVLVSVSSSSSNSDAEEKVGGAPVRGKLRKMMLRYELSPVFRPIQKGELADNA